MRTPPIRKSIIEALRLAASAEEQKQYAADVPSANVVAEVFCGWEDNYVPDSPRLRQQFNQHELQALATYEAVSSAIASQLPEHLGVAEFQARSEWKDLASAAKEALAALGEQYDDTV